MGLYKTAPPLSGRMGALWSLASVRDAAVIEFGCMGHMVYGRTFLHRMGVHGGHLYSTHLGETDIAMGDTSRLFKTVRYLMDEERPNTIFLLPSSVPEIIGVDLDALSRELSAQFPETRFFPVSAGGFGLRGHQGVEQTLLQLAGKLPKDSDKTQTPTFNIIGSCADMFRFGPDAAELSRLMEGAFHVKPLCVMTSDAGVAELERMGGAHMNLVIRREGEAAAQALQKRFGTPYLSARPYGIQGTGDWLRKIESLCGIGIDGVFLEKETAKTVEELLPLRAILQRFLRAHPEESALTLAGHADVVSGIAEFAEAEFGFRQCRRYCDCPDTQTSDMPYLGDKEKRAAADETRGFLMGSGELLRMAKRDGRMQIAYPDDMWRHNYEPPFAGFRGAVHLASLWVNEVFSSKL